MRSGPRRTLVIVVALAASLAILWQAFLLGVAAFMAARSPLERADAILPLYHDSVSVSAGVADLYRQRLAPRVILYRVQPNRLEELGLVPPAHETWRKLLVARGVPSAAIETIASPVKNAIELGAAVAGLAHASREMRVIAVASAPVARLTRNALRQGLAGAAVDLRMHPVTPRSVDAGGWWRSRAGWIVYFDAYCLWLLGFLR